MLHSESNQPNSGELGWFRQRWSVCIIGLGLVVLGLSITANLILLDAHRWALEQSAHRIEREHGIVLPPSASGFRCAGDAWRKFFDRGASSIFILESKDLPAFKSQLSVNTQAATHIPGNEIYQGIMHPWRPDASPLEVLSCDSPTGDWLHVEIWPIDDMHVAIWMYTDWN